MKTLITILALVSAPAFAIDYLGEHGKGDKLHACVHAGFKSSEMSDEQHKTVHEAMMGAKAVMESHKDAIRAGMGEMMAAWKKHPVVKDEVAAAEANLTSHFAPVKEAMRDALITGLNVLSDEQRGKFDHAFMHCMHHGDGDHGQH